MVTPAARREAVAHLRVAYEVSERRACSTLGADRTSVRYRSIRPDDAPVRARLRELAAIRRRFGYRRLHILLTREGVVMNHKKLRRLYREERLQVRRRGGRKRALLNGVLWRRTAAPWRDVVTFSAHTSRPSARTSTLRILRPGRENLR
jgi:putative transposase